MHVSGNYFRKEALFYDLLKILLLTLVIKKCMADPEV